MNLATTLEMIDTQFERLGMQARAGQERMIEAEAASFVASPYLIPPLINDPAIWPPERPPEELRTILKTFVDVGSAVGRAGKAVYDYNRQVKMVAGLRALDRVIEHS